MQNITLRLLATTALLASATVQAQTQPTTLPTGGNVAAGAATITQSGSRMDVTQSSQRSIINWQSFNIGNQAWVNFNQPNSSAVTLNRVTGGNVSEILGKLTANGQVFLVNPSGIVFGRDAQINVGGLVGSTMSIRDDDFMAGNYRFQRNGSTGQIINQGSLTASERGYIALLAPELRNEGLISARLGTVALAAGETVVMQIGQNVLLQVEPATIQTLIDNRAMVMAEGGRVILTAKALDALTSSAINTSGVIRADSLVERGGEIVLEASGSLNVSGTVSASGTSGGTVTASANGPITLTDASITADGSQGAGGKIEIGSWATSATTVNAGTLLSASAGQNGDGGSITLFSQDTRFSGRALARGGSQGGDGGFIETSGILLDIGAGAAVDASAARGQAGEWLLDPNDLTIGSTGAAALSTALATTNVTLNTSGCPSAYASCVSGTGNVSINSSITPTVTAGNTVFTVRADGGVSLADNTSIAATSGSNPLTVQFQAGNSGGIYIGSNSSIITRGGGVIMTGGGTSSTAQGVAGSNGGRGLFINGSIINAGGGSLNLRGKGADGVATSIGIDIASGSQISTSGSGQIQLTGIGGDSTGGPNGFSSGINIGSGVEISTTTQAITITGTQATTSTNPAYGISFDGGTQQTAIYSGSGGIGLTATGGKIGFSTPNGSATVALGWDGVSSSPTTNYVNLTASDVQLDSTRVVTLKAANVNISANSLAVSSTTTATASTQATIYPSTFPGSIGIGTGAGLLSISDAVLSRFQTSTLLNIGGMSFGPVTIGGTLSAFTTPVRIMSSGAITLDNGAAISSTATGTAITLAGASFINNGGTVDATNGRWLIRSVNPANDTRGALTGFERYSCSNYPTTNCSNVPTSGNGFTYTIAGTDVGNLGGGGGGSSSSDSVADQARRTQASTDSASISRDVGNAVQVASLSLPDDGRPRLSDLLALGQSPLVALEFGYTISNLRTAGYSVEDLRAAGIPLAEIREGRYSPVFIKEAGYSINDMLAAGYGIKDLSASGYPLADIRAAGVSLADLKASGYPAADLRNAGFSAAEMRDAGFTLNDLWQHGYPVIALRDAGYDLAELKAIGVPAMQLRGGGASLADLRGLGYSTQNLRDAGYTYTQLVDGGTPLADLSRDLGLSDIQLKQAGLPAQYFKDAGYGPGRLHDLGYTPAQLLALGYSLSDLKEAGYTLTELRSQVAGLPALKAAGFDALSMKNDGAPLTVLLNLGYPLSELRSIGYSADELKPLGLPAVVLRGAGYSLAELKLAGYPPEQLRLAGYSPLELGQAGYLLADMRQAGYPPSQLRDAGYSVSELSQAGYPAAALRAAGFGLDDLSRGGVPLADLKALGFPLSQLITAGFGPAQLLEVGFNPEEMRGAGLPAKALLDVGLTPDKLKGTGYGYAELSDAGYPVDKLVQQGYSLTDLRSLGTPADALRNAGYSIDELRQAGYDNTAILRAGYPGNELLAAGYSVGEMILEAGLSASSPAVMVAALGKERAISMLPLRALLDTGTLTLADYVALNESRDPMVKKKLAYFVENGISAQQLIEAGYTATALMELNYSVPFMLQQGVSLEKMKADGVPARRLAVQAGIPVTKLKELGYSVSEIASAGADLRTLLDLGFSPEEAYSARWGEFQLGKVERITAKEAGGSSIGPSLTLARVFTEIHTGKDVETRYSMADFHNAGISAAILRQQNAPASDLIAGGYTPTELYQAGYPISQVQAAGVSAAEALKAGYSRKELRDAGYRAADLLALGDSPQSLLENGFSAVDLLIAGVPRSDSLQLKPSQNDWVAKYSVPELLSAGIPIADLLQKGFSAYDLLREQVPIAALRASGVSAEKILDAASLAYQAISAGGTSFDEIRKLAPLTMLNMMALHNAGYTMEELTLVAKENGTWKPMPKVEEMAFGLLVSTPQRYSIRDPIAALAEGANGREIVKAGYSVSEVISMGGFTLEQLIAYDFPATEMLKVFDRATLIAAGMPAKSVAWASQPIAELITNGTSIRELAELGFNVSDMLRGGMSVEQLRAAGVPFETLVDAVLADQGEAKPIPNNGFTGYFIQPPGRHMYGYGDRERITKHIETASSGVVSALKSLRRVNPSRAELDRLLPQDSAGILTAIMLRDAGYSNSEITALGFNPHLESPITSINDYLKNI